ncbi:hypothetical protein V565_120550 [Rhizoctonia solani 123E]|uniref:Uncharacterized protein n=1 Tax=Rhizoctonia solani 123E TaxID=1423351 RepID=A0A074RNE1_9AGAM|nr:hypothetical protein V565_120550 [Rhizoctonia solani 123E]
MVSILCIDSWHERSRHLVCTRSSSRYPELYVLVSHRLSSATTQSSMDTLVDSSHLGPVHQGIQHAIGYASNSSNNESTWRGVWSTTFVLFHIFSTRLGAALVCQTIPEFLVLRRGGLTNPLAPLEWIMTFSSARTIFRLDPDDDSQHQLIAISPLERVMARGME